jgi:glycosyltransferase involved in cell wall biosynthesis
MKGLIIDARFLFSSGLGVYLRTLLPAVLNQSFAEKIIIYCRQQDREWFNQFRRQNIEIRILNAPSYSLAEQFFWFKNLISHRHYIFWSPQYNIPLIHFGPLVATVHDLAHLVLPEYKNNFFKFLYAKMMFFFVRLFANKIICVSNFTKSQLIEIVKINESRIEVIHLGLDKVRLTSMQTPMISLPKHYALFVGNIKNHKNIKNLILSIRDVQVTYDLDLVIIGQREGFITSGEDIFKLADSLKVRYVFSGTLSDAELAYVYGHASLLAFPSIFEGFGLPPLEAMSFDCPVVASNAASIPEVCGSAAVYFDPYSVQEMTSAIIQVISDDGLRAELISRGKERLHLFDVKSFQSRTLSILSSFKMR